MSFDPSHSSPQAFGLLALGVCGKKACPAVLRSCHRAYIGTRRRRPVSPIPSQYFPSHDALAMRLKNRRYDAAPYRDPIPSGIRKPPPEIR